jgi:hypothetical protein
MNSAPRFLILAVALLMGFSTPRGVNAQTAAAPPHVRPPAPANAYAEGKKSASGEAFFIVASLDLQKSQLLLKYPTEVTLLEKVTDKTQILDDSGKPLKLSDLRTGDTVWVTSTGTGDSTSAVRVRKGQMTVAELHRHYLDYAEIK